MRYITKGKSGSIVINLPRRPSGAGTATVCDADGAVTQASPTVTLDAVDTALAAAATAGAQTLSLTSATGLGSGRQYLVNGPDEEGGESVIAASLSGTTLTLARRTLRAHAPGETFKGTRLAIAITTDSTATARRCMRVEWTDPDTNEVVSIPFDVVRFSPVTLLTVAKLRELDPQFTKRIPADLWIPGVMAEAWDKITDALAEKDRIPGGFAGTIDLTRAHGYLVRALLAETGGDDLEKYRDDLRLRYKQELDGTLAGLPYDEQGTGATTPGKGVWRGIQLVRS